MRNQMLTEIIRIWGMEHKYTIEFAEAMETATDAEIIELYENIIDRPIFDEDETEYIESDCDEFGYNPYLGCYDFDC